MTELVDSIVKKLDKKSNKGNIQILKKFDEHNVDLKESTRRLQINIIVWMLREINKDFKKITKSDIKRYFTRLSTDDKIKVKPYTKELRRIIIVKFFKWLYKTKKPKITKDLKPNPKAYDKIINPNDLWTDGEVKKLVDSCIHSRDRALIMTLYDSGSRSNEPLSMTIEDVKFEGDTCSIYLPTSKTQKRRVGLIFSVPYLQEWINNHPLKNNPKAPLFVSFSPKSYLKRLKDSSSYEILIKARDRAGINKKINHHILRHSRISKCRKAGLPDALNRKRHGLAPGSTVIERYTHIDDEEVQNGYLKAMGYEPKEPVREDPEILKPKKCVRCGVNNPVTNRYCRKCYSSLDYESVQRDISVLEVFKTRFAQFEGIDLDKLLRDYQQFKAETSDMQRLLDCFNGHYKVDIQKVRKQLDLKDEDALELLQYLVTAELIDMSKDKVYLKNRMKFEQFVTMQKRYLEFNSH